MIDLSTAGEPELQDLLATHGAPPWRAAQLRRAAWRPGVSGLGDVVEVPRRLREELAGDLRFSAVSVASTQPSDAGRTQKLLCRLADGQTVETVVMETPASGGSRRRATVCVSSQVGCAVGCPFCATGQMGLRRSCTAAEIVDQVRAAAGALAGGGLGPVTHVVYMGMGEPLANLGPVIESLRALASAGISPRRMTVSTSGVVPAIDRLAEAGLPVTLAVSLHAADDALRDHLVPLNRAHPVADLLDAATRYARRSGRRLSLEWCLIGGVNDSREQAVRLRALARRSRAHVNVIPMNRIAGSPWGPPPPPVARAFLDTLEGVRVTVRDTRGADADAACGQLRAALAQRRRPGPDGRLGPPRRQPGELRAAGAEAPGKVSPARR